MREIQAGEEGEQTDAAKPKRTPDERRLVAIKPLGAALGPVAIGAGGLEEAIALFEQKVIGHEVGARRVAHARERVKDAAQLGVVAQRPEREAGMRG